MLVSGLNGGVSLILGSYLLLDPEQAIALMGGTRKFAVLVSWTNILVGAVLLGMVLVTWRETSLKPVAWNVGVMASAGLVMLALGLFQPFSPSPAMIGLGALMLASSLALRLRTHPRGRVKSCPGCGSEKVVAWGSKGLTYCTRCDWYFGAIPETTSIMVSGDSGIGKTMLILKLAEVFQSRGRRNVFVCCDQPPTNLKKILDEAHESLATDSGSSADFTIVDSFSSSGGLQSDLPNHTQAVFDLNEMEEILARLCKEEGDLVVTLDSINPLLLHNDAGLVLKFLDRCRSRLTGRGEVFVFSITEGSVETSVYKKLESIVDAIIEMRFAEEPLGRARRLRFTKMRGQNIFDDWVYFDLHPKEGIVFLPIERKSRSGLGLSGWLKGPRR